MNKTKLIFSSIILLFGLLTVKASSTDIDKYQLAEQFVEEGNYYKALDIYLELLKTREDNANLQFKVGFCYLNTSNDKEKAIPHLEKAITNTSIDYQTFDLNEEKAPIESLFFLGEAYMVNYRFDDAIKTFLKLKEEIGSSEKQFIEEIDYEIACCNTAKELVLNPVDMTVSNLGVNINTPYIEHSPVISGDEQTLIFTSQREGTTGNTQTADGQYFEDIFISKYKNDEWQKAEPISTNINTKTHEASIGLSFDGKHLFIYKDDGNDGNIYISTFNDTVWSVPQPMPKPINTKYKETHACMSFDQQEIYFTSDRKGGYGGLDIYRVRKLPNGKWSKAQNLGPDINTPFDEDGPYLHPDGTTLFFASKGHKTMGGFDIFSSENVNGQWQKPKNIGYPINTPNDDIYYIPSVDGRRAYYSSFANNSLGEYDLFRIDLSEKNIRNQTVVAGIAQLGENQLLDDATVTVYSIDDELVGVYTPDATTRKFLIILPIGKTYKVEMESSNYGTINDIIQVPAAAYEQSGKVVNYKDIIINRTSAYKEETPSINQNNDTLKINIEEDNNTNPITDNGTNNEDEPIAENTGSQNIVITNPAPKPNKKTSSSDVKEEKENLPILQTDVADDNKKQNTVEVPTQSSTIKEQQNKPKQNELPKEQVTQEKPKPEKVTQEKPKPEKRLVSSDISNVTNNKKEEKNINQPKVVAKEPKKQKDTEQLVLQKEIKEEPKVDNKVKADNKEIKKSEVDEMAENRIEEKSDNDNQIVNEEVITDNSSDEKPINNEVKASEETNADVTNTNEEVAQKEVTDNKSEGSFFSKPLFKYGMLGFLILLILLLIAKRKG